MMKIVALFGVLTNAYIISFGYLDWIFDFDAL